MNKLGLYALYLLFAFSFNASVNATPLSCDALFATHQTEASEGARLRANPNNIPIVTEAKQKDLHPFVLATRETGTRVAKAGQSTVDLIRNLPFLPPPREKSPLEPKPLPIRVIQNLNRWYFQKDTRDLSESKFNFLNDRDYIQGKRNDDKLGIVRSFFSKKYDTRIYYTATAVPDANGVIPPVDPKSRALFIYFHGSGTNKASGANFAYKMNKLARIGYSTIAMDLPWHSDGSRDRAMLNPDVFYANLKAMIDEYRVPGQPVYLAGHSFGPDVAAEFVKRYPFAVDGLLMISPGSFNKTMEEWFANHTAKMTALWGDVISNDDGAAWAGIISSKHTWRILPTPESPDPTIVNPNLKVRILTGEWEEYVPGELDERGLPTKTPRDYDICKAIKLLLSHSVCTVEPKVGHYIFEHKDDNGQDVILREMMTIDGQDIANEKALRESSADAKVSEMDSFAIRFVRDPFFNAFINSQFGGWPEVKKVVDSGDLTTARRLTNDYSRIVPQRERAMAENLKNTAIWNPVFYHDNKSEIDQIDLKKPRMSDPMLNRYFKMLESITPEQSGHFAVADASVMSPPERTGPPPHIVEKLARIAAERAAAEQAEKNDTGAANSTAQPHGKEPMKEGQKDHGRTSREAHEDTSKKAS